MASYGDSTVQKINPATGAVGLPIAVGANPIALAFDGSSLWVANYVGNSVMKINPATGVVGTAITVGAYPTALAFDGSSIWVANYSGNSVQKINPTTGAVGAPITVGTYPQGLAFDGSNIWVANFGSGTVTKLAAASEAVGVQTVGSEQINGAIAATKLDLSTVVSKAGDTMTGQLVLPASGVKFSDGSTLTSAKSDCSGGRYEDNDDGTVSDCRTGLVWLKNANCLETAGGIVKSGGSLNWTEAATWATSLGDGLCGLTDNSGFGDWRLPTKTEWIAMVANAKKQGFKTPALTNRAGTAVWTAADLFDNVQSADRNFYWSNTSMPGTPYPVAWCVNMGDGNVSWGCTKASNATYVWPVRAGQ